MIYMYLLQKTTTEERSLALTAKSDVFGALGIPLASAVALHMLR